MHEAGGHCLDAEARRDRRRLAGLPADRPGNAHRRKKILAGFGEYGIGSVLLHRIATLVAACCNQGSGDERRARADESGDHLLSPRFATRAVVTLQPRSPAIRRRTKTIADKVIPVGTTVVHASRV